MKPLFVSFEGIDGSGKTTQAGMLCESIGPRALGVREPGGTALGERLRALVKDSAVALAPTSEALLFAAARAELVADVVRPALAAGRVVVCDRFVDSSLAYQGAGRGLGIERVARVNELATGGLVPDITVLLWLSPEIAASRLGAADHFETLELQREVASAYERLEAREPQRFRRIAADRPPQEVHAEIMRALEPALATAGLSSDPAGAK